MNWYSIFYWISVADGVKSFFDVFSNVFSWGAIICLAVTVLIIVMKNDKNQNSESENESILYWLTFWRRSTLWLSLLAFITWGGYVFTPSKKDALLIVAGGAVGQFITSDTSARQLPAEAMNLLRAKIRSEIVEINTSSAAEVVDTLEQKTKEELIEILKNKK